VTGAGWIITRGDSVGLVPSKKTNFGFNLKYKTGTTYRREAWTQAKGVEREPARDVFDWL